MTAFTHDVPGTPAHRWHDDHRWRSVAAVRDLPSRLVVVGAHPDDESLGAGGLIATAADAGREIVLVVLTHGERSHPHSPTHSPEDLAERRGEELTQAARVLAPLARTVLLDFADGGLAEQESTICARLVEIIGDGRDVLVVAPWRHDGHPDHESAGRAAAAAAVRCGAALVEYPVWFWHWADPDTAPWRTFRALDLPLPRRERKAAAIRAHRSQVEALSDQPGDEVLLGPDLLAHFLGTTELLVVQPASDPALDELHEEDDDPWGASSRWYEQRKRDLLMAALPRRTFRRGLEVGCSTGLLAARIAERTAEVVAVDRGLRATELARRNLSETPNASVLQLDVPSQWPEGRFDLVVVSEVGYFLSPKDLDALVERTREALTDDGVVVLCHWSGDVEGWVLDGGAVHTRFEAAGLRSVQGRYRERLFEILVLAEDSCWPGHTT